VGPAGSQEGTRPNRPIGQLDRSDSATNKPLTAAVPGQPTVTYTYDALDRRASCAAGTSSETYSYLGTGTTIGRIDRGAGGLLDSVIDAAGARLTVGGAWLVPTVRGDVAALLNRGGTAVSDAYRYDPYGLTLASLGTSANPYRFAGRLQEPTSGEYDFGSRQYDPALAAFTSLDTVMGGAADPASLNRYLYAHANPESMVDPDGHASRALADEQVDRAAISKLTALRSAAAAADAAVRAAVRAAERADAAAARAQAAAHAPCRLGDPDDCAAWRHSRQASADAASAAAAAAWANVAAVAARAAAAHRAVAQAERALAAAKRRSGEGSGPVAARPALSPYGGAFSARSGPTCGTVAMARCPTGRGSGDTGGLHLVLGGLGAIPIVGIAFDAADAFVSALEGDIVGVGLSLGAMVPFAGDALFNGAKVARAGVKALKGADEGLATARALGRAGEEASGVVKNTTRIDVGAGRYRVPDGLSDTTLSEVKNVGRLSLTAQLRDYASYAQTNGLRFDLHVRPGAELSNPLRDAIDAGIIILRYLP